MQSADLRLVLDTNTALSGLLWLGSPSRLIDAARHDRVQLVTSEVLLAELHGVILRRKFGKQLARRTFHAQERFQTYRDMALISTPARIAPAITRDFDDDHVLAAALGGQADLIVSGDAHLLDLKRYLGIPIVTASEAVARITLPS